MKRIFPGRWALAYAIRLGWPVIPLWPRSKKPVYRLAPHGADNATTDPEKIRWWWRREPAANIAVVCRALLVLDVDVRHGGAVTLDRWIAAHGELPQAPLQETGRGDGSRHIIFERPPFETVGTVSGGIDIIAGNRCFTVAPSTHRLGGRYRWLVPPCGSLPKLPIWLAQLVRQPAVPLEKPRLPRDPRDRRIERAVAYAAKLPPAVSGQHGHNTTMRAAVMILRGFDLTCEEAFQILSPWNLSCLPPWSERELKRKIDQAERRGRLERGCFLAEQRGKQ